MKVKQSKCELEGKYYRWIYSAILLPISWEYLPLSIALKRRCFEVFYLFRSQGLECFLTFALEIFGATCIWHFSNNELSALKFEPKSGFWGRIYFAEMLKLHLSFVKQLQCFFLQRTSFKTAGFSWEFVMVGICLWAIEFIYSDKEIKTNFKPDFQPWLWFSSWLSGLD